jgi:hypothetical protein
MFKKLGQQLVSDFVAAALAALESATQGHACRTSR